MHDSQIWLINWINVVSSLSNKYGKDITRKAAASLYGKGVLSAGGILIHTVLARIDGLVSMRDYSNLYGKVKIGSITKVAVLIVLMCNKRFLAVLFKGAKLMRNFNRRML